MHLPNFFPAVTVIIINLSYLPTMHSVTFTRKPENQTLRHDNSFITFNASVDVYSAYGIDVFFKPVSGKSHKPLVRGVGNGKYITPRPPHTVEFPDNLTVILRLHNPTLADVGEYCFQAQNGIGAIACAYLMLESVDEGGGSGGHTKSSESDITAQSIQYITTDETISALSNGTNEGEQGNFIRIGIPILAVFGGLGLFCLIVFLIYWFFYLPRRICHTSKKACSEFPEPLSSNYIQFTYLPSESSVTVSSPDYTSLVTPPASTDEVINEVINEPYETLQTADHSSAASPYAALEEYETI